MLSNRHRHTWSTTDKKVCHCIIWREKNKNTRLVSQYLNCLSCGHSSNFRCKPPNCIKCHQPHATRECKHPLAHLQNASTEEEPTRPILPTFLHIRKNLVSYINGNHASRLALPQLFVSSKLNFQLSSRQRLHPDRIKRGLKLHLILKPPTDPQSLSSVLEPLKSILAMFDIPKLCETLHSLVLQLQTTSDPLS